MHLGNTHKRLFRSFPNYLEVILVLPALLVTTADHLGSHLTLAKAAVNKFCDCRHPSHSQLSAFGPRNSWKLVQPVPRILKVLTLPMYSLIDEGCKSVDKCSSLSAFRGTILKWLFYMALERFHIIIDS